MNAMVRKVKVKQSMFIFFFFRQTESIESTKPVVANAGRYNICIFGWSPKFVWILGKKEERQILHKLCRWVRESKWKQNQVKEIEWQQGSNQKKTVAKP